MQDQRKNGRVIIVINHLDEEDFFPFIDHCAFKDQLLTILDSESIPLYATFPTAHIQASFKDLDTLLTNINKTVREREYDLVGIIGLDEEYKYAISKKIADVFGLLFYDQTTIDAITNKYTQRLISQQHGIPVPRFTLLDRFDVDTIPFPNVLKVVSGISSEFVYLNNNQQDLQKHLHIIEEKSNNPQTHYIIEEFVSGDEYSCDFLVEGESIQLVRVVKKIIPSGEFGFFGGFYLFNPFTNPPENFDCDALLAVCKKIATAFGLVRGMCMVDFKFDQKKLSVIECTIRPGISQFIELMIALYRYTSIDMLIAHILKLPTQGHIPDRTGLIAYVTTNQQGRLTKFDTSLFEKDLASHCSIKKYYIPGDLIVSDTKKASNRQSLGHVIKADVLYNDIPLLIEQAHQKITIEFDSQ